MKFSIPAAFSSSAHSGFPAMMNMARPFKARKAGIAYSAYSSSLEQSTTISALAAIAASTPASTVSKPRLSITSYPAQARKLQEYCARAWRIARLPIVSIKAFGRLPLASVSRRNASNWLAARSKFNVATSFSQVSCPPQQQVASTGFLSPAFSLKLGNWLVPNRTSRRWATALWRALLLSFTAAWTVPAFKAA